jgi:hypothetical protein
MNVGTASGRVIENWESMNKTNAFLFLLREKEKKKFYQFTTLDLKPGNCLFSTCLF